MIFYEWCWGAKVVLFSGEMARFRSQSLWLSIAEKSSVPTLSELWHLGQQCNSSTASLGVSSHGAGKNEQKQVRRVLSRLQRVQSGALFRNAQGSSSKYVVSQGTFCQWSGMEKRNKQRWFAKYDYLSNFFQQLLTVFVYACQSEFVCIPPQRGTSAKEYRADDPKGSCKVTEK